MSVFDAFTGFLKKEYDIEIEKHDLDRRHTHSKRGQLGDVVTLKSNPMHGWGNDRHEKDKLKPVKKTEDVDEETDFQTQQNMPIKGLDDKLDFQKSRGTPPRPGLMWRLTSHRWIRPKQEHSKVRSMPSILRMRRDK